MNNYLFAVAEVDGMVFALIAEENDFARFGGLDDQHISQCNGGKMPDILGWDEEAESYFMPWNEVITPSDAFDDLLSKGLKYDPSFVDWCEQSGDGNFFRPV